MPASFIPNNLAIAPSYPKAELPNLLLRKVVLDRNCSFQIWSPKSNAILQAVEADLLISDRLRVEAICTRLVSLLGATCSEHEDHLLTNQKLIYYWEDLKYFTSKYGFKPSVIDVLFSTHTIRQLNAPSINSATQWVVEPACWEIFFLELKAVANGYQLVPRPQYLSVIVWTGLPTVKYIPQMRMKQ
ncbi:hypothetical protein [Myxosarcina sp. GI1]|uniref:hypothetical protein n=1 Tax=Myxosarcina sp. GI1 TaxID=1541065 RepID=UPI00055A24D7|nr:hypothetical protein [Myxosarcina sp. GI1]